MADSNVPITAGSGTNIDTFTQSGGDHRQAMVLGDAVNADVAGVANGGLGVNGGTLVTTSGAIAAAATGTIGPLNVATSGNVTFTIKNTVAASAWAGAPVVVFEQSDDNTSWAALPVVRSDTGQIAATFTLSPGVANGSLMFDAALEGVTYVRARVTTGPTTNGLTIVIDAGGMPFPQGNSLLSTPLDGNKPTYIGVTGVAGGVFAPHSTLTIPWLQLWNPIGSGRVMRVLRVRLEFTLATAAMLTVNISHDTSQPTGGTSTNNGLTRADLGDSASVGSLTTWSVAPANNSTNGYWVQRRLWAPLATTAASPGVMELFFGAGKPAKAGVIRPGEGLGCRWGIAPATAATVGFEIEFTEEPA